MSSIVSSFIRTNGSDSARRGESVRFPFPGRPQSMTVYLRFVELGTITYNNFSYLLRIGNGVAPQRAIAWLRSDTADVYEFRVQQSNAVFARAVLAVAPTVGDIVELNGTINAANGLTAQQAINGGTISQSTSTSAVQLPITFGGTSSGTPANLWLGSLNVANSGGFVGIMDVHVQRGVLSMQSMRRLAGVARV